MATKTEQVELCRAGGIHGRHENYALYHVTGWQYWEDGSETLATNCIYCGAQCA